MSTLAIDGIEIKGNPDWQSHDTLYVDGRAEQDVHYDCWCVY